MASLAAGLAFATGAAAREPPADLTCLAIAIAETDAAADPAARADAQAMQVYFLGKIRAAMGPDRIAGKLRDEEGWANLSPAVVAERRTACGYEFAYARTELRADAARIRALTPRP